MNQGQQQWKSNPEHEDNDGPKHVYEQIAGGHDDDQTDDWVVLLKPPRRPLAVSAINKDTKGCRYCCKATHHLHRVKDPNHEEHDDGHQEIVCLEVIQVVHHPVRPFIWVVQVWHLEAR